MSNKPLLLLQVADAAVYKAALDRKGVGQAVDIETFQRGTPPPDSALARADILLAFDIPAGMLTKMPKLRFIQSQTVGVDGWLARGDLRPDLPLAAARGTHRVQMPENILGALFHATKPYAAISADQKERKWMRRASDTLAGKTLGILGLGAIGAELARKAAALELTVIGTKRTVEPLPHVAKVYAPDSIDEVLGRSHFVVLLLPATEATVNLMNATRLAGMRKDAWLLNFARGALVVDEDLIAAVKARTIAGAILDVFRTEPLPEQHPFWTTPGIHVLPHIGGMHPDRDQMVAALFADNVTRVLNGETPSELVDRKRGY
ncbi:MAG TPA: D-2-hydroxyacid dehydrogenase [Hyphomicrobiaceae bacterium]|nr:D-2-hydroxyacid dehydrogenase [Hyphomicrobiaceae bacterium]